MGHAGRDVLPFLLAGRAGAAWDRGPYYFVTFFLPAIATALPLRVRALVCVR